MLGTCHVLPKLNNNNEAGWGSFSAAVVDLALKAGVQHAALFAHNLIVAATPAWDHLPIDDRVALQVAVASLPPGSLRRDIPVHLPKSSPDTAHRLVTGTLVGGCTR